MEMTTLITEPTDDILTLGSDPASAYATALGVTGDERGESLQAAKTPLDEEDDEDVDTDEDDDLEDDEAEDDDDDEDEDLEDDEDELDDEEDEDDEDDEDDEEDDETADDPKPLKVKTRT